MSSRHVVRIAGAAARQRNARGAQLMAQLTALDGVLTFDY